jgi:hypothetical protein
VNTPIQKLEKPKVDLTISTGRDFVTKPELTDEWRCFAINPKLEKTRYLTALNIKASNPKMVHHVAVFQVTQKGLEQSKILEVNSDGRGGYPCLGAAGVESRGIGLIGFWVPGSGALQFPEGTAAPIAPGDGLVLQTHYNTANGAGTDQTSAELSLLPAGMTPKEPLSFTAMIVTPEIACPGSYPSDKTNPCNRDYAYDDIEKQVTLMTGEQSKQMNSAFRSGMYLQMVCGHNIEEFTSGTSASSAQNIPASCEQSFKLPAGTENRIFIRGALGHMHFLGASFKFELVNADKTVQTVLDIPRWDFHWQNVYWLEKPIVLKTGQKFRVTCTYNNSQEHQPIIAGKQQPPRYVVWGERTTDEMCAGVLALSYRQ